MVINIESSHCYPPRRTFFAEAARILRPEGIFLFADLVNSEEVPHLIAALQQTGFHIQAQEEITPGVLEGLDRMGQERSALVHHLAPHLLRKPLLSFAGVPGTACTIV